VQPIPPASDPIFIVGLPRSGTTLMAVCLDRHPAIHCGPETDLFARLTAAGQGALDPSRWPDAATDLVVRIAAEAWTDSPAEAPSTSGGPDLLPDQDDAHPGPSTAASMPSLDRALVRAFLAGRLPSAAAVMEALVALPAAEAGKRRWAEKTPRHLDHLRTIREAWPSAAVIRMVRDPRSRAVSMSRVPFGPDSQVANLLDGLRRDRRAQVQVDADPRLLTVRLEDLQADPESTLQRVCEFLGEPYDAGMLVASEGAAAVPSGEWWKRSAIRPVTPTGSSTWPDMMPDDVQRFASLYCAEQLERHGYQGVRKAGSVVAIVPWDEHFIRRNEAFALALARRDMMLRGLATMSWRRLRRTPHLVYWGPSGSLMPKAGERGGWGSLLAMTLDLAVRRLQRRPAGWVRDEGAERTASVGSRGQEGAHGMRARCLGVAVGTLARRMTVEQLAEHVAADPRPRRRRKGRTRGGAGHRTHRTPKRS
jgi:hypothetical protein